MEAERLRNVPEVSGLLALGLNRSAQAHLPPCSNLGLDAMENAVELAELDIASFRLHSLTGNLAGRSAITVTRNWRITFAWRGESAVEVDMEDYHGT